jgi:hypothetical protein
LDSVGLMLRAMTTRLLSAGLWLLTALYAGSLLHATAGTPELLGPALGLSTAGLIVVVPVKRASTRQAAFRVPAPHVSPDVLAEPS